MDSGDLPVSTLKQRLVAESPRLTPRPSRWPSKMVRGAALVLFVALLAHAAFGKDLSAWAIGIAYILYDTGLLAFTAVQIAGLRRATVQPPPADAVRPTLGVIIAARNEAGVLGVTIDRLAAQSDPPELIVVADDGSDDGTGLFLQRVYGVPPTALGELSGPAAKLPALRWMRLPHGGKARALNRTIGWVETDVLLTVDADTLLEPQAIAAMRAAFTREPELVAATGVLIPICGPSPSGRLFEFFQRYEYIRNFLSRYAWMRLDSLLLISGAFSALRRTALEQVGGFDPQCMVEDYELIHRLHRHAIDRGLDWRVRVVGEAMALTDVPASVPGFLRQRRRWFCGFLQTQFWNRDMIGNRRFGYLGTAMMPVKTLDTLQPLYGLAAFAILLFVLATGQYAVALPIVLVMLAKIALDLAFHLWSLGIYARWTGAPALKLRPSLLAVLAEPFTFQLLRHAGAAWGWFAFLAGRHTWHRQARTALTEARLRAPF